MINQIRQAIRSSRLAQITAVAAIGVVSYSIYAVTKPAPAPPPPMLSAASKESAAAFEKIMAKNTPWASSPMSLGGPRDKEPGTATAAQEGSDAVAKEGTAAAAQEQIPLPNFETPALPQPRKSLVVERIN